MAGFGVSIPVFFVTTYAWVFWIASPVLGAQLRRQRRRLKSRTMLDK
jgi:predicted MFS family arabinose efflux permease